MTRSNQSDIWTRCRNCARAIYALLLLLPPAALADGQWTTIFRSSDPSIWDTDTNNGPGEYAIPIEEVPADIQWLRLRRVDTNDFVVIPITRGRLKSEFEIHDADSGEATGIIWNGTAAFYERTVGQYRAHHLLGIAYKGWFAEYRAPRYGVIALSDGSRRRGYAGWGFGKGTVIYSSQTYVWDGAYELLPVEFEISVNAGNLTAEEQNVLLTAPEVLERLSEGRQLPAVKAESPTAPEDVSATGQINTYLSLYDSIPSENCLTDSSKESDWHKWSVTIRDSAGNIIPVEIHRHESGEVSHHVRHGVYPTEITSHTVTLSGTNGWHDGSTIPATHLPTLTWTADQTTEAVIIGMFATRHPGIGNGVHVELSTPEGTLAERIIGGKTNSFTSIALSISLQEDQPVSITFDPIDNNEIGDVIDYRIMVLSLKDAEPQNNGIGLAQLDPALDYTVFRIPLDGHLGRDTTASDIESALLEVNKNTDAIILLDVSLTGADTTELAELIRVLSSPDLQSTVVMHVQRLQGPSVWVLAAADIALADTAHGIVFQSQCDLDVGDTPLHNMAALLHVSSTILGGYAILPAATLNSDLQLGVDPLDPNHLRPLIETMTADPLGPNEGALIPMVSKGDAIQLSAYELWRIGLVDGITSGDPLESLVAFGLAETVSAPVPLSSALERSQRVRLSRQGAQLRHFDAIEKRSSEQDRLIAEARHRLRSNVQEIQSRLIHKTAITEMYTGHEEALSAHAQWQQFCLWLVSTNTSLQSLLTSVQQEQSRLTALGVDGPDPRYRYGEIAVNSTELLETLSSESLWVLRNLDALPDFSDEIPNTILNQR